MAKKKNPKLNDDDLIEDDGIPMDDATSTGDDDLAITEDFDPTAVIAEESAGEDEDGELPAGYTMGEFDLADMPSERTEDAKMLEEGIKIAKQMEHVGEEDAVDDDSSVAFDANDGDIFDDYEDDDAIYDRDDY